MISYYAYTLKRETAHELWPYMECTVHPSHQDHFYPHSHITLPFSAPKYLSHKHVQGSAGMFPCILHLSTKKG
jgi:hypothetical protein